MKKSHDRSVRRFLVTGLLLGAPTVFGCGGAAEESTNEPHTHVNMPAETAGDEAATDEATTDEAATNEAGADAEAGGDMGDDAAAADDAETP